MLRFYQEKTEPYKITLTMSKQSSKGHRFYFPSQRYSMDPEVRTHQVFEREEDYIACRGLEEKVVINRTLLSGRKFSEDRTHIDVLERDIMKRLQFLITMERNMAENYKALRREIQQHLSAIPEDILLDEDNHFISEYYREDPSRREHKPYRNFPSLNGVVMGDLIVQLLCLKLIVGLF